MKMLRLFFLLFVLLGCRDDGLYYVKEIKPDIIVHPTTLDFGHLLSGHETKMDRVTVINAGNSDLFLDEFLLDDPNSRYTLVYDPLEVLEPEQIMDIEITYTPETYEDNPATLTIISNDEETSHIDVSIAGSGDAPVLKVFPEEADLGQLFIGCDGEDQITFMNLGNLDLVIEDITQLTSLPQEIYIDYGSLPVFPWNLVPGDIYKVDVNYKPRDIGSDDSRLTITNNDPMRSGYEIQQYGDGVIEEWFIDSWEQEEIPILDILWVIDNSGSMSSHQSNLSTNISYFMNNFIQLGVDYNMAVITTDRHSFTQIITSQDANPVTLLAQSVVTGTYGSGVEKGIQMAYNSLSDPNYAGQGGSFLRQDAKLVVIFVSDEPDHSQSTWTSYTAFFDQLKPAGYFIPFGIIGDPPTGCGGGRWQGAMYGAGYFELIQHYGGSWYSICETDWGTQMQSLGNQVVTQSRFSLSEEDPVEETIAVFVDGQQLEEGWSYDSSSNQVVFDSDYIPEPGETIRVEYALWGC
jgi:hypothetical protein